MNPNKRNQGSFGTLTFGAEDGVVFEFLGEGKVAAAGIIVSRRYNKEWFRSNCKMALSEAQLGERKRSLLFAAEYENIGGNDIVVDSDLYLNNAGVGGFSQSTSTSGGGSDTPQPSDELSLTSVVINGITQNAAGGSAAVNFPLSSIQLIGSNLDNLSEGQSIKLYDKNDSTIAFLNSGNNYTTNFGGESFPSGLAPLKVVIVSGSDIVRTLFTITVANDEPQDQQP